MFGVMEEGSKVVRFLQLEKSDMAQLVSKICHVSQSETGSVEVSDKVSDNQELGNAPSRNKEKMQWLSSLT